MIDHLLWAVPDLETGSAEIAQRCGIEPQMGGQHPGVGTHNSLLGLGPSCYLEIIALDPRQREISGLGEHLLDLQHPRLLTWCAVSVDLEALAAKAEGLGLRPSPITDMQRRRPDGRLLSWRLLFFFGHGFGPTLPFAIDWLDSQHPSRALAGGCRLDALHLSHPRHSELQALCAELWPETDRRLRFSAHAEPCLAARLACPAADVHLGTVCRLESAP